VCGVVLVCVCLWVVFCGVWWVCFWFAVMLWGVCFWCCVGGVVCLGVGGFWWGGVGFCFLGFFWIWLAASLVVVRVESD
ncbi:hypothetical protein RA264_28055, partial [Pseudomonas syringae pv. tagetis]|uniref:hypothetical protein n=1 Tax=Pseudomonas syringae group genomosp. 7 TaxID=251699 RepID=UPI0037705B68